MKRMTKEEKAREKAIEAAFYRHGNGIPINIMNLSKISEAGRKALQEGTDLDTAVKAAIELYREDKKAG
jgi:hypothetical protein